jgi:predicted O-methyltransferase YrrM
MDVIGAARSKLETLAWFAARPSMYRELGRRIVAARVRTRRSLTADREAREAGQAWCGSLAKSPSGLLAELGIGPMPRPLAEEHPELWRAAHAAFETCRGSMGGPAHLELLRHLVRSKKPSRVVETGVAAGWSSLAILSAMEDVGAGHLTSVDMPYPKRQNEALVGCVVPQKLKARWTLVRLPDRDAIPGILKDGPIALAHYDSDKSHQGRTFAYEQFWNALEPEGLLFSDDVEDNLAFSDFARRVGRTPWVIEKDPGNFAGILVR